VRHFAKDERGDVTDFLRSDPMVSWWPRGRWVEKVGIWLMERALPKSWWDARDESRRRKGLPL
jgi:hypothetical protein